MQEYVVTLNHNSFFFFLDLKVAILSLVKILKLSSSPKNSLFLYLAW